MLKSLEKKNKFEIVNINDEINIKIIKTSVVPEKKNGKKKSVGQLDENAEWKGSEDLTTNGQEENISAL